MKQQFSRLAQPRGGRIAASGALIIILIIFLAACRPSPTIGTPTAPLIRTYEGTEIVFIQSLTPSPSFTSSPSPSVTSSPSRTATLSQTPRPSASPSPSPSLTSSPSRTATLTDTPQPSASPSPSPSLTSSPSRTATLTDTPQPSASPSPSPLANLGLNPQTSPTLLSLAIEASPSPNPGVATGLGAEVTLIPFASPSPLPTLAPFIPPTPTSVLEVAALPGRVAGVAVLPPEQANITLEDSRQVSVIRPLAAANGSSAQVGGDQQLYINGGMLTISPASIYGLPSHMRILDLEWTSDGRYLAFVLEGHPGQSDQTGVWVLDSWSNSSWQVLRNDDRHAARLDWSPNGTALLIHLSGPNGGGITFLPREHQANEGFREHGFSTATWAPDSASVMVAGGGNLGRVWLDAEQSYQAYDLSGAGLAFASAPLELLNGQVAFLGGEGPAGPHRLYLWASPPIPLSPALYGEVRAWEWNPGRSALLLTLNEGGGPKNWLLRTDGSLQALEAGAAYWD